MYGRVSLPHQLKINPKTSSLLPVVRCSSRSLAPPIKLLLHRKSTTILHIYNLKGDLQQWNYWSNYDIKCHFKWIVMSDSLLIFCNISSSRKFKGRLWLKTWNNQSTANLLLVICILVLTQVPCCDLEWGLARAFDAVTDGLASRPMRREEQVASWPIRAQLLKPGRLNGSEEKRRQGNEAEELDVGQSRSSLAPDRSRFGSRRTLWELFCGIGWTRGGRDIKKGGGQICGPRCVTLLGNPGYQQLHTLLAPSTPATHCTNVHGTTRGWLVGSWWCPAQREALTAPESNHPTSTIQQKALRHDSGCCNLLSMRHYSLQYLTLRQNHTRLVITRAIKS